MENNYQIKDGEIFNIKLLSGLKFVKISYDEAFNLLTNNVMRAVFIKRDLSFRLMYATRNLTVISRSNRGEIIPFTKDERLRNFNLIEVFDLQLRENRIINLNTLMLFHKFKGDIPLPETNISLNNKVKLKEDANKQNKSNRNIANKIVGNKTLKETIGDLSKIKEIDLRNL